MYFLALQLDMELDFDLFLVAVQCLSQEDRQNAHLFYLRIQKSRSDKVVTLFCACVISFPANELEALLFDFRFLLLSPPFV